MKFLFDENLSYRLVSGLADIYPHSKHAADFGLGTPDVALWDAATTGGLTIVSKDTDFYQRFLLFGHPPKTIWLRVGNAATTLVLETLRAQYILICHFIDDPDASFLVLP